MLRIHTYDYEYGPNMSVQHIHTHMRISYVVESYAIYNWFNPLQPNLA